MAITFAQKSRFNAGSVRFRTPSAGARDRIKRRLLRGLRMKRRDFIIALGGATAFPAAVRAQQSGVPLIGFLSSRSPEEAAGHTAAFLQGLKEFGYVEGKTAGIDYRWSRGRYEMLPALARELVALRPALIVAGGGLQA